MDSEKTVPSALVDAAVLRPSERHEALIDLLVLPTSWLRADEPIFRHWDRLPVSLRNKCKQLQSDDIATANWHFRKPHNAHIHRAAVNEHGILRAARPPLRWNVLL